MYWAADLFVCISGTYVRQPTDQSGRLAGLARYLGHSTHYPFCDHLLIIRCWATTFLGHSTLEERITSPSAGQNRPHDGPDIHTRPPVSCRRGITRMAASHPVLRDCIITSSTPIRYARRLRAGQHWPGRTGIRANCILRQHACRRSGLYHVSRPGHSIDLLHVLLPWPSTCY
ncbi:hypothetical protein M011DRAFT_144899 [Sporormia fimetaria CBS 119925]|uniref:Uncharacterized protein n=1 Tax=Sporormia fimetaria CBS 119925 TaxID=1340428 RepID=A0A6A6V433_9PLEO|nr:hypothetical protein M011DRAFT_144899 [Sporormia fimetaria CBS 119925]